MATPWPKPVEPNCSRSLRLANTADVSTPSRWPASSASCFMSERLLPPGRAVLIASVSRKSASCIRRNSSLVRPVAPWPLGFEMESARVRFYPADIPVFAPVDHVELTRGAVLEHQRRRVAKIHQHHSV